MRGSQSTGRFVHLTSKETNFVVIHGDIELPSCKGTRNGLIPRSSPPTARRANTIASDAISDGKKGGKSLGAALMKNDVMED